MNVCKLHRFIEVDEYYKDTIWRTLSVRRAHVAAWKLRRMEFGAQSG
jgi:hypothetical protein